jgi:hypothetical protein
MHRAAAPAVPLALFIVLTGAGEGRAWGPTGHRAVGRVAERHLTPAAAQAVAALLGREPLAYVTTWADDVRSEEEWRKAESWHWVTVPDGQAYASSEKNPAGDVLEAIARMEKVLADRQAPVGERATALRWLAHLIGDLHQPLHVGRGDDRGGNETVVLWFGQPSNLHAVWDHQIIETTELSFSELAELLMGRASAEEAARWQTGTAADWAAESQQLRSACYELGDRRLSYRYVHDHRPTVELRILQAGMRLAYVLNRHLSAP